MVRNRLAKIHFESDLFSIRPLGEPDLKFLPKIESDIFEILNSKENTRYIPDKYLSNISQVQSVTFTIISGYTNGNYFSLIIVDKRINKTIGVLTIISSDFADNSYGFPLGYWLVDYYLNKKYWGHGIMSGILLQTVQNLNRQGVRKIGALCDINNIASIKTLNRANFKRCDKIDYKQDFYIWNYKETTVFSRYMTRLTLLVNRIRTTIKNKN